MYVGDDEKIPAIGWYIRYKLVDKVKEHTIYADLKTLFGSGAITAREQKR